MKNVRVQERSSNVQNVSMNTKLRVHAPLLVTVLFPLLFSFQDRDSEKGRDEQLEE